MLRLGLVGFGKWGRNYVRAALAAGNAQVCEVVLPEGSMRAEEARGQGLQVRHGIDDLAVDAVVVAAHPSTAPDLCEQLLRRGIPVMVEKPAALSVDAAQRIVAAAQRSKPVCLVAHQHLFATAYEHIRSHVQVDGDTRIITRAGGPGPYRDYPPLWDYGPHDAAMIWGLVGTDPLHIAMQQRVGTAGSHLWLNMQFAGGASAACEIWNDGAPKSRYFQVQTAAGDWIYDDVDPQGRLQFQGRYLDIPYEPPLTRALRCFADAVICGGTDDDRFGAHWALRVADWLSRAQDAATPVA